MKWSHTAGALILAGLLGWMAGGWIAKSGSPKAVRDSAGPPRATTARRSARAAKSFPGKDFASLLKRHKESGGVSGTAYESLQRASTVELRELLVTLSDEKVNRTDWPAYHDKWQALFAAARELYRREGRESLVWADGAASEELFTAVLCEAAREDATLAREWLPRLLSEYGKPSNAILEAASRGAAMRGAEDLLAVENLFHGGDSRNFPGFAEGFDFPTYLARTSSQTGYSEAIRCWSALDPAAVTKAFREGLLHLDGSNTGTCAKAFQARAEMAGDAEAARWVADLVALAPDGIRTTAVREFASAGPMSAARIDALVENLPTDGDRAEFLATVFSRSRDFGNEAPAVRALTRMNSPQLQSDVLRRWVTSSWGGSAENLERLMEAVSLPTATREDLRKSFAEGKR